MQYFRKRWYILFLSICNEMHVVWMKQLHGTEFVRDWLHFPSSEFWWLLRPSFNLLLRQFSHLMENPTQNIATHGSSKTLIAFVFVPLFHINPCWHRATELSIIFFSSLFVAFALFISSVSIGQPVLLFRSCLHAIFATLFHSLFVPLSTEISPRVLLCRGRRRSATILPSKQYCAQVVFTL